MATPAENTQNRKGSSLVDGKVGKSLFQEAVMEREKRRIRKEAQTAKSVSRSNEFVNNWLRRSKEIIVKHSKVNASAMVLSGSRSEKSIKGDANFKVLNVNEDDNAVGVATDVCIQSDKTCAELSEVSFNPDKVQLNGNEGNKGKESANRGWYKEKWDDDKDDSIEFGHSAMSGRSSTARQRAQNEERRKKMANLHSSQLKNFQLSAWFDHEENSQEALNESQSSVTMAYQHEEIETNVKSRSEDINGSANRSRSNEDGQVVENGVAGSLQSKHESASKESGKSSQEKSYEIQDDINDELNVEIIDQFKKRLQEKDESVFYDMFKVIITKLSTVQNELKEVKNNQSSINDRICELERVVDVCTQSLDDIDAEIDDINDANLKHVQALIKVEGLMSVM